MPWRRVGVLQVCKLWIRASRGLVVGAMGSSRGGSDSGSCFVFFMDWVVCTMRKRVQGNECNKTCYAAWRFFVVGMFTHKHGTVQMNGNTPSLQKNIIRINSKPAHVNGGRCTENKLCTTKIRVE